MSAGRRILFLMFHGQGHFNPVFSIARKLQQDHEVIFSGAEYFTAHVANQGFAYFPLRSVPFGMGLETWFNSTYRRKPVYLRTLVDRWRDSLYQRRERELNEMLRVCAPTHIILDGHQVTDFIILHKLTWRKGIPIALVHTMPPATTHPDIPPMNSLSMPDDHASIRQAHKKNNQTRLRKRIMQSLLYFGMHDARIIQRRLIKNQIPPSFISDESSIANLTLTGIPEFILSLQALDFPTLKHGRNTFYIGAHIDPYRRTQPTPDYESRKQSIDDQISAGNKLIYCAIGTVISASDDVLIFLRKLIVAIPENATLIISARLNQHQQQVLKQGDHIFIFDHVPQLDVLAKAAVFVTHAGLNSIHEAIEAEVPMLAVPLDSNFDCKGNATRVAYHGIGLRADAQTESTEQLKDKIRDLMADLEYKRNLREMKSKNAKSDLTPLYAFINR